MFCNHAALTGMSLHNAITRKRTPQNKKRDFYAKEVRVTACSLRWNREQQRLLNRIERKAAKRKLRVIAATFQHIAAEYDLLHFRQTPSCVAHAVAQRPAHWLADRAERQARIAARQRVRRRTQQKNAA